MPKHTLPCSDNYQYMCTMPSNSVESIVTDSPYGYGKEPDPLLVLKDWLSKGYHEVSGAGFMGRKWDAFVPQPIMWKEAYRILKPGGYLLSTFGPRTYDWGVMALRLAGFEIRDCIMWVYSSGWPKSVNVKNAIADAGKALTI